MSPERPPADGLSRRQMLTAGAAAIAAVVGAGTAAAQDDGAGTANGTNDTGTERPPEAVAGDENLETRALIIPPEGWNRPLDGAFVHVGGEVDPASAAGSDQCDYATWPDKRSRSYDVTLIAPEDLLETQQPTTLYLPARLEVTPGTLYMVEQVNECPSGYRGLYLRRLGVRDLPGGSGAVGEREQREQVGAGVTNGTETDSVQGPGFGPIAALLGLGSAAGLAELRRRDDGD